MDEEIDMEAHQAIMDDIREEYRDGPEPGERTGTTAHHVYQILIDEEHPPSSYTAEDIGSRLLADGEDCSVSELLEAVNQLVEDDVLVKVGYDPAQYTMYPSPRRAPWQQDGVGENLLDNPRVRAEHYNQGRIGRNIGPYAEQCDGDE